MFHSKRSYLLLILFAITALAGLAFVACDDDEEEGPQIGSVDVLGIWGDEELVSFETILDL